MVSDRTSASSFTMSRRSQSAVSLSTLGGRVSRSVDRDVGIGTASTITSTTTTTSRTIDYDRSTPSRSSTTPSGRLQSTPRPPLPTILSRRRYSLSSAAGDRITRDPSPSTFLDAGGGIDDDDGGGYRRRRTPISWSRKDVVYTADGMRSMLNGTLAPGTNHTATPRRSPSLSKFDYSATAAATAARNRSRRRLENEADDVDLSYVGSSVDADLDEARRRARESRSRSRAASLSRVENTVAGVGGGVDVRRRTHRAASVVYTASSASSSATANSNFLGTSSSDAALRRLSSRRFSLPATAVVIRAPYTAATARYYNGTGGTGLTAPVFGATMPDSDGLDLTAFVLAPGEKFVPTDVRVSLLPSGKQAITYTRFSQKGHGDQTQANAEIERIIQRTRRMQDQMHTLETFVQRNRSLFPEDIIIYQHIIFYLLDEAELRRLGERRTDAEVYGVKIRERLVAPYGTDVTSILKRYYSRYDEVDVEYTDTEEIRRRLRDEGVAEESPSGGGGRRRYRTDVEEVETTEETTGRRPNGRRPSPLDDDLLVVRRRPSSRDRSTSQGLSIDESLIGVDDLVAPGSRRRRSRQEAAPQFTARLHPKRIRVGDTMRLNCSVTGEPEPKVTWYYGKEQIHNDGYYNISNTFGLCSLKVLSVDKNDSGCYTAKATNHLGEVSTSADIIVEDDEETVAAADTDRGTRKPWFVVDARNTYAEAGQRAVFEAQATGTPPPSFKWKKDNVDVILDNRVRVVSDDLGNTKLVIRDVRSTDAGVYFCIAENSAGKAKCAATLRVINADETDHRAPVNNDSFLLNNKQTVYQFDDDIMSRGRWPQFVQTPPLHIDVYEGDPLTLRCVVEGDPTPVVTWYKGVRELTYSERHRVIAEGEGSHLMQIKSTLQTDPGEYTAVATNSCGHSKFTTVVNVLPRPRQDDDQQMSKPKPVEREFELVKRMEQGKMPPIFIIKLPREKTIKLGQTLLFDCHIEEAKMRQYLVGVDIVVKDKPDLHPNVQITSTAPDEQLQQRITSEQPVSA